MAIFGAQNTKVYVKTASPTPTAFTSANLIPQGILTEVAPELSGESVEYETYASINRSRIASSRDFSLTLTLTYDPNDTALDKLINAFNSQDRLLDVLLVVGDEPKTGAKNLAVYGRMAVESISVNTPSRNIVTVRAQLRLADGATLVLARDVTAFPSL